MDETKLEAPVSAAEGGAMVPAVGGENVRRISWGRVACVLGLISAGIGALFSVDVSLGAVGILFGVAGYGLGARRLGTATIVISTLTLLLVPAMSQGYIPGPGPMDPLALPNG